MSFSLWDREMTAERRQYWAVYPSVTWRYYGPCTTMHELSDSSWRVLAVGRVEYFPSLPDIRSTSTNMTQLATAKWLLKLDFIGIHESPSVLIFEFRIAVQILIKYHSMKHVESFEMWWCRRIEKTSSISRGKNEEVLQSVKEERNIKWYEGKVTGLATSSVGTVF
jgi:hypothetical protein